jgi:hypothetical protein
MLCFTRNISIKPLRHRDLVMTSNQMKENDWMAPANLVKSRFSDDLTKKETKLWLEQDENRRARDARTR